MGEALPDVYIPGDIEADGPIRGAFSMPSFGFSVAGRFDGDAFRVADPEAASFYRELAPMRDRFDPDPVRVSGSTAAGSSARAPTRQRR